MNRNKFGVMILAGMMVLFTGMLPAGAVDRTWTQGGANQNWSTPANWTGTTVPTAADRAVFYNNWVLHTAVVDTATTVGDLFIQGWYNVTIAGPSALRVTNSIYANPWWYGYQIRFNTPIDVGGMVNGALTSVNWPEQTRFIANGNVFRGGFNWADNYLRFEGNANVFSNTLRVAGRMPEQQRNLTIYSSGYFLINGTANTFGTGQFVLDPCGHLAVPVANDFSAITNVSFNGGTLDLGVLNTVVANTWPVLTGGFNVKKGRLWVWEDGVLGSTANGIQLGSPNYYGELFGSSPDVAGRRIERAIILNGNGGRMCAYNNGVLNQFVGSVISGTGELMIHGYHNTYLANGAYAGLTPNLYSGGTRVSGNLVVQSLRTLGSGDLRVQCGTAELNANTALASGAKVFVGGIGLPTSRVFYPAFLRLNGANVLPNIDPSSYGGICINGTVAGTNWLNPQGRTIIAGWSWGSYLNVVGPAPGSDGVYRFTSSPGDDFLGMAGGLYGTNALEIGVPYSVALNGALETGWGTYQGGVEWNCVNTFSGPITVHQGGQLTGWSQPTDGASPFGATNGAVYLNGGLINAAANILAERIQRKGPVYVQGGAIINAWDRGATNFGAATFGCDSIQRKNLGCVKIQGISSGSTPFLGSANRVRVFNSPPSLVNNMVAPWMMGNDAFLSYDAAVGFTNAPWTQVVAGPNFPSLVAGTDIVNVNGPATLQNNPSMHALRVAGVTVLQNGANTTMTIGSGGLMVTGTACRVYPNLVFGSLATPVEGIIHNQVNNDVNQLNYPILYGQITASSLTKFGEGNVAVLGSNIGTLQGPTLVNQGILMVTNANAFGSTTNWVILNGGTVGSMYWTYAGPAIGVTNGIKVGPLGGGFGSGWDTAAFQLYGPISDWIPGDSGPLRLHVFGNGVHFYGTNTYSGGTIVGNFRLDGFCSLGTGPVRVDSGLALFTYPSFTDIPGRMSLNGVESTLGIFMCTVRIGSLDGNGYLRYGDPYTDPNAGGGNPDGIIKLMIGSDNTDAEFFGQMWEEPYRFGALYKIGTGNQTLWNDCTIHRDTVISNGTLTVNGGMPFTPNVWVWPGARLTGKGAFSAPAGNVILIGNSTLDGTLRFDNSPFVDVSGGAKIGGNVVFSGAGTWIWFEDAASSLQFNLSSPSATGVTIDGLLDLADYMDSPSSLNVTLGFAPVAGQVFTVVNNTGSQAIYGEFANAPNNGVLGVMYGGKMYYFRVNYAGGDGNDIVLTTLPFGSLIMLR